MTSLKNKLNTGEIIFGTWSMLSSPNVIEVIGSTTLDFVIIDREHGSMSFETVENMIRAGESKNLNTIIRVSSLNESEILKSLETNPAGIMVPHIETPENALAVSKMCHYFPEGTRGLSPYTRAHNFDHSNITESLIAINKNLMVGILVEGKNGIANIDKISKTPGIDLIYLGIYDISQAVGHPGEIDHPEVVSLLKLCIKTICKNGKTAGTFVNNIKTGKYYSNLGIRFLAYLADSNALKSFYQNAHIQLKK